MTTVDSDDDTVDGDNPLFGRINGAPRFRIALHVTPNKKRRNKRDGTDTQHLLKGKFKVFRKKTTHVCSYLAETDALKNEMWVYHPKTNRSVLHSMCIEHTTFSDKYIIIQLLYIYIYIYAINASLLLMQV